MNVKFQKLQLRFKDDQIICETFFGGEQHKKRKSIHERTDPDKGNILST
jgi:hypothetical protein